MMKKKEKKSENSERWLITYSDLITLLMIFFIVMYSMSNVSENKYEGLSESLNSAMGTGSSIIPKGNGVLSSGNAIFAYNNENGTGEEGSGTEDAVNVKRENYKEIRDALYDVAKNSGFEENMSIEVEDKGIVIMLSNDILFDSGHAEIKDSMKGKIAKVAVFLKRIDNAIEIGGHTDNVPIRSGNFESNWQLSAQRAANVVQYLVDEEGIEPSRLSAIGYGEYKPLKSNDTEEGRSNNRRISITILFADGTERE